MYDIIPLILILVSLSIICWIAVRKFPALASLDVHNIPAEKEAQFKQRIVSSRLKRNILKRWSKFSRLLVPVGAGVSNIFKWIYAKLIDLKASYHVEKPVPAEDLEKRIIVLFEEVEILKRQEDLAQAEKKLIEIISLDSKNTRAFKMLAGLYFDRKDLEEAKQTYEHILKLHEGDEDAFEGLAQVATKTGDLELAKEEYSQSLKFDGQRSHTYYNLALVCEEMNNLSEALANIKEALKIEPVNPRYLDTALRISIIIKDKSFALDAYEALKKTNPDNQKLVEFKEQIDLL